MLSALRGPWLDNTCLSADSFWRTNRHGKAAEVGHSQHETSRAELINLQKQQPSLNECSIYLSKELLTGNDLREEKKPFFNRKTVKRNMRSWADYTKWISFLLFISLTFSVNSSMSFLITHNTHIGFRHGVRSFKIPWRIFLCLSFAIQTLEQCNSLWKERRTPLNCPCLRTAVDCLIELHCLSEGPSLRLTKSSQGRIMLFKLSVEMKRKTTYQHLDIASLWQIRLVLLEWWLGMAGQRFMNSQCGEVEQK